MVQDKDIFGIFRLRNLRGKQNRLRLAKFIIIVGFIIVAIVFFSVFIPRAGISVEVVQRAEVIGTMELISVRVSNNNFETLQNVTVQFGENGSIQPVGNMGPFSSIMITPERQDWNFDKIIVEGNNGATRHVQPR
ncbi:MAG: hypothetical protein M3162_05290 [Thermoproteota archaeon]|nr:hypothetical protein [Thermoproteota archaeon]